MGFCFHPSLRIRGPWQPPQCDLRSGLVYYHPVPVLSFPGRIFQAPLPILSILALSGCWTPASVQTQPAGPPRLLQSGIPVQWFDRICKQERSARVTVFVSREGMLPASEPQGAPTPATARVLRVNVSYRLLTVRYSDSREQTFKVGRDVQLAKMQSGDDVIVQSSEGDSNACKP